ncbi:MAG: TetR/AcrR family transcriptional regulator [Leptonema sp. (in: bacteria)]
MNPKSKQKPIPSESIERIILASIDCVSKYGYEGASTEKIANLANVSKSLIHYHFKTKEDLLIKSLNYFANEISEEIKLKIRDYRPSVKTTVIAAKELYNSLIANKKRAFFFIEMYSTAIHNKKFKRKLQKYHQLEENLIEEVIYQCLHSVEHKLVFNLRQLAKIFQTLVIGLAVQTTIDLKNEDIRERFDTFLKIITSVLLNQNLKS